MNRLKNALFFFTFWRNSFERTGNLCAFKQMMRYFDRLAELYGVAK